MQYNCNKNTMPHWYTRSHDGRALLGGGVVSDGDDEEHPGVLGQGSRFDSEDTLTRRTTSSHQHPVSPAIVIPPSRARGASNQEGRSQPDEDVEHAIVTREYDMATWRMYFRILDHRVAKSLSSSSTNDEPDRGGGPAGGVPIVVSLSEEEDSSWSMDTSDRSDASSSLVHSRHYEGVANGRYPILRMMVPRRPAHISIDEREEEEEQQQEEMKALLVQFDDDEEDDGIFQFDL